MGMWVPMTAMPQRIALSLTFSALAATLVGVAEFYTELTAGGVPTHAKMAALGFEIMLGAITVGGTLVAAGKLQEWITSRPVTYPGQNLANGAIFLAIAGLFIYLVIDPSQSWAFYALIGAAFVYVHGLSGLWLDFSGALGLFALALLLARRVRREGAMTLPEIVGRYYGGSARVAAGLLVLVSEIVWFALLVEATQVVLTAAFGLSPIPAIVGSTVLVTLASFSP